MPVPTTEIFDVAKQHGWRTSVSLVPIADRGSRWPRSSDLPSIVFRFHRDRNEPVCVVPATPHKRYESSPRRDDLEAIGDGTNSEITVWRWIRGNQKLGRFGLEDRDEDFRTLSDAGQMIDVLSRPRSPAKSATSPAKTSHGPSSAARRSTGTQGAVRRPAPSRNWTEKELVLVLELYLRSGKRSPRHSDTRELARTISERKGRRAGRCSANQVASVLAEFATVDPHSTDSTANAAGETIQQVWDRFASDEDWLSQAADTARAGQDIDEPETDSVVVIVTQVEARDSAASRRSASQSTRIEWGEGELVKRYRDFLGRQRHTTTSHLYQVDPGRPLQCDLFDETERVLFEAKNSMTRESFRMALGQLLDYRHLELAADGSPAPRLCLLLPRRPSNRLVALATDNGIGVVWQDRSGFGREDPATWLT